MPSSSSQYLSVAVPYAHGVRSLPDLKHVAPASSPSPTSAYRSEYICKRCRARIATRDAVLSWDYRGMQGKAALVTQTSNLTPTPPTVLLMDSGAYRVQHLLCSSPACSPAPSPSPEMTPDADADTASPALGWRFLRASERAERWKEGCVVLELALLDEVPAPLSPVSPEYAYEPRYRSLAQFPLPPSSSALLEPEPAYAYDSDRLSPEPLMMHRRTTSGGSSSSRSIASRTPSPSPSPYGGRRTPSPLVPSHELGHARSYSHSRTPSCSQLHAHSHSYSHSHSRPHTSHTHLHPITHALSSHSHSLSAHHTPPRTPSPSPLHRRAASDLPASRARTPTNASPAAIARAHTTTATTLAARRLQPLGPRVQRASVYHAV